MGVSKLPVPVSIFGESRKITALRAVKPLHAGLQFDILGIGSRDAATSIRSGIQLYLLRPTNSSG